MKNGGGELCWWLPSRLVGAGVGSSTSAAIGAILPAVAGRRRKLEGRSQAHLARAVPDVRAAGYGRILQALGTLACRLRPRGKAVGRPKGRRLATRARQSIVRKGAFGSFPA